MATTVVLAGLNNLSPSLQQKVNIHAEMARAKESLLAYAFNYPDLFPTSSNGPGRLPCTDSNNNGVEDCLTPGARLPETLTLESGNPFQLVNTYAGIDQQFWYYVSPAFARNAATQLNTTTAALFSLDSQTDIVAVIVAPGDELPAQNRSSGPVSISNYLEASNASGVTFINAYPLDPESFNDQVLGITRSELMSLASVKVAIELQKVLDEFYLNSGAYPVNTTETEIALTGSSIPGWFNSDGWNIVTAYNYDIDPNVIQFSFVDCASIFTLNFGSGLEIIPKRC